MEEEIKQKCSNCGYEWKPKNNKSRYILCPKCRKYSYSTDYLNRNPLLKFKKEEVEVKCSACYKNQNIKLLKSYFKCSYCGTINSFFAPELIGSNEVYDLILNFIELKREMINKYLGTKS